jgi:hypothetical protein
VSIGAQDLAQRRQVAVERLLSIERQLLQLRELRRHERGRHGLNRHRHQALGKGCRLLQLPTAPFRVAGGPRRDDEDNRVGLANEPRQLGLPFFPVRQVSLVDQTFEPALLQRGDQPFAANFRSLRE